MGEDLKHCTEDSRMNAFTL